MAVNTPPGQQTGTVEEPPLAHPTPRKRALLGSRRRQIIAAVVILGALAFLAVEGLSNATVYFKTADQAVKDRQSLGSRDFRIEGTVGQQINQVGTTLQFSITANGVTVPVVDTGSPSQLFKKGIPVVLEGHWNGTTYDANQIMVKHSASYTEAHPNRLKPQPTPGNQPPPGQPTK